MERQNFSKFTIWRVVYELKNRFSEKSSLYREIHYIEYFLYGELTVLYCAEVCIYKTNLNCRALVPIQNHNSQKSSKNIFSSSELSLNGYFSSNPIYTTFHLGEKQKQLLRTVVRTVYRYAFMDCARTNLKSTVTRIFCVRKKKYIFRKRPENWCLLNFFWDTLMVQSNLQCSLLQIYDQNFWEKKIILNNVAVLCSNNNTKNWTYLVKIPFLA